MSLLTSIRASSPLACLLALAVTALAQAPSPDIKLLSDAGADLPPAETIHARVDEVNVVFTVTTSSGRFVNKLSLADLNVLDNQRQPERISYFQQQSELPLRVGILVDTSSSITDRFTFEKKAAIAFLRKVLRPQVDEAFLVGFASRVTLVQDFTSDIGALSQAVGEMRVGGETRLYDAIQFASAKLAGVSGPLAMRRAIILITDGEDTRSKALLYDAIQSALRAETVIFALSSNRPTLTEYPQGDAILELITRPTGGSVHQAHTKADITRAFAQVREALRNQYALGYKPAEFKRDGKFHAIRIVPRKSKLRVQCRRGYFAPREDQADASRASTR